MHRKKVGVVCGGYSSEYEISLQSGKNVFSMLDREKWEVFYIVLTKESWTAKDDFSNVYNVSKGDFSLNRSDISIKNQNQNKANKFLKIIEFASH